jgi:hypothetical protein
MLTLKASGWGGYLALAAAATGCTFTSMASLSWKTGYTAVFAMLAVAVPWGKRKLSFPD